MAWVLLLKFIVAFVAIASTLLFISSVISAIVNPQIELDKDGHAIDTTRNSRIWFGLIMSLFWAIMFIL